MSEFLAVLAGVFKFWDQVTWLVKTIQGTPEDHRQAIIASIRAEAENFEKEGRPSWN